MAALVGWDDLQSCFEQYRRGEQRAARRLFAELIRRLRGFFQVRLRDEEAAADLAQAVALKLHFARDRFDGQRSLKTWVFTVAERCLIDHYRAHGGDPLAAAANHDPPAEVDTAMAELGQLPEAGATAEARLALTQELRQAMTTLIPTDQTIVYLYGVEEFSMAEIGAAIGLSEGAVKVRAHRSYQKLRAWLSRPVALLVVGGLSGLLAAWLGDRR